MLKRKIMIIGFLAFCLTAPFFIGVTSSGNQIEEYITQFPWTKTVENTNAVTPSTAASGSWLSGWLYRKAHNITGSTAGVQVNYPIMVNVRYDNGFDFEGEVYLGGKCRIDFGDIRFTDLAGNSLDYWIPEKVDGVLAAFWVEIGYIPQSPDYATIYIYYGNPNASTTSNKDWTVDLATGFEDNSTQGWSISWLTDVDWDGTSTTAYQGNYSRGAGRHYGTSGAGNGHFYERFQRTQYLAAGSYRLEGAGRFQKKTTYLIPKNIQLFAGGIALDNVANPETQWYYLSGNFTLSTNGFIQCDVEFHILVQGASSVRNSYYIDSILLRKWCDPEPVHSLWGTEETYETSPIRFLFPVTWKWLNHEDNEIWLSTNVTVLSVYSVESFSFNRSMEQISFNVTSATPGSCNATIPKLLMDGGFKVLINDIQVSCMLSWNKSHTYVYFTHSQGVTNVKIIGEIVTRIRGGDLLSLADLNGDGIVDIVDVVIVALRFGWKEDC